MFTIQMKMWLSVCMFLMVLLMIDHGTSAYMQIEHRNTLDRSGKDSMYAANNVGDYRTNDEISVDPVRFVESYNFLSRLNSGRKDVAYRYAVEEVGEKYAVINVTSHAESQLLTRYTQSKTIKSGKKEIFIWDDK